MVGLKTPNLIPLFVFFFVDQNGDCTVIYVADQSKQRVIELVSDPLGCKCRERIRTLVDDFATMEDNFDITKRA